MSSNLPRVARALFLILTLPFLGLAYQDMEVSLQGVSDLLLKDDFEEAAEILEGLVETADVLAFKGEIEFRRGRFEAAGSYYTRALELEGNTPRAHFGLGKLRLGKMRLEEAIESLGRAVELEPEEAIYHLMLADAWAFEGNLAEQIRQLEAYVALEPTYNPDRVTQVEAALEVIRDFGSESIGAYELPDEPEPIAISQGLNLIFADLMVGDRGPFEFIVDTGASQTVFTEALLDDLGLIPIASTLIHGIGGEGTVESNIYRIDELVFGNVEVRNLPVGTLSDPLVGQLADGIFSTATFSDELVSIDYPRSRIEFNVSDDGVRADHIPAWFFSNLVLLPLEINDVHEGLFLLDTGAVTTVLSHNMAANLGVHEDTPGARIGGGIAGIAGAGGTVLLVPDVTLETPENREYFSQVVSVDLGEISETLGFELSGVIGYDFLRAYRISIDFQNAEVVLSK